MEGKMVTIYWWTSVGGWGHGPHRGMWLAEREPIDEKPSGFGPEGPIVDVLYERSVPIGSKEHQEAIHNTERRKAAKAAAIKAGTYRE